MTRRLIVSAQKGTLVGLSAAFVLLSHHGGWAQQVANSARAIEPFLDGGTWAVVCSDVDGWSAIEDTDALMDVMRIKHPWQAERRRAIAGQFEAAIPQLRRMGVRHVWIIVDMDDMVRRGGAPLVIPIEEGVDHNEALRMAKRIAITTDVARDELGRPEDTPDAAIWLEDRRVVLSGSEQVVEYYSQLSPEPRADLLEPLEELMSGGALTAAVLSPGRDARRAVRELWPADPPPPLQSLTGAMVADDVRWVGVELRHKPRVVARIVAALKDESTAARLEAWLTRKLEWLAAQTPPEAPAGDDTLRRTAEALRPRREGSRLVLELDPTGEQINAIRALVTPLVNSAKTAAAKNERLNRYKQVALALLNYETKHKRFPPAASRDESGKPLLSWRVHVLPFLGEEELYDQFHLDEPWDSPHNRQLLVQMPEVYADPGDELAVLDMSGETTLVAPVAAGSVFASDEGTALRSFRDSTSHTLLIVEVASPKAVPWTAPRDWEVDLSDPAAGVARKDRDFFTAAFCDGSTDALPTHLPAETLKAMLTIRGSDRPRW